MSTKKVKMSTKCLPKKVKMSTEKSQNAHRKKSKCLNPKSQNVHKKKVKMYIKKTMCLCENNNLITGHHIRPT